MTPLVLETERDQRRAADANASAWVSASAGSGKTKVLVDRLLTLLLSGAKPHRLLCLTYTKAAAAEMANRLSMRLSSWVTLPEEELERDLEKLLGEPAGTLRLTRARRLFAQVLDAPGGLHIQTLHAFAQSLLARFPIEAGVAPHFSVMDERDQAQLLDESLQSVLAQARLGRDESLSKALEQVAERIHETRFADLMRELSSARTRLAHLFATWGGVAGVVEQVRQHLGVGAGETLESLRQAACREEAFDGKALRQAVSHLSQGSKTDKERAGLMAHFLAGDEDERSRCFDDYVGAFLTDKQEPRASLATNPVKAAWPGIEVVLESEQARIMGVIEQSRAITVVQSTEALLRLAHAILEGYAHLKEARARLDYDDLIQAARRLIQQGTAWVLYKLDGGIDHVLIDEAQDTSPAQWDIVTALSDEFFAGEGARPQPRTVFAVGDVKQSIYSFQGADPDSFETMRARLSQQVAVGGGRWEPVDLVMSFRSVPAVLEAVDAVFAEGEALEGVDLGQGYKRHLAFRAMDGGSVDLWPPLEPKALDEQAPWHPPVERIRGDSPQLRMARLLARRIRAMIGQERLVSKDRLVRPGDILILLRRRGSFAEDLVRSLKAEDVPVAGVDRMIVTDQLAVVDLMALARFVLLPEDDLNLAALLKGPFIGLSEEELFSVCHGRTGTVWEELLRHQPAAHAWLSALRAEADRAAPHDFFAHILGPLKGRRTLKAHLGQEALDAVDEFMSLALDFERHHVPSLSGFLAWMEAGHVEIKRDSDSAEAGFVRVMTVHGAKGLQAPIVFLPDTLTAPAGRDLLVWSAWGVEGLPLWAPRAADQPQPLKLAIEAAKARARRESHRLLYVAMTRAEDRLIMAGWRPGKSAEGAWYPLIRQGFDRVNAPEVPDDWLAGDVEGLGPATRRLTSTQIGAPGSDDKQGAIGPVSRLPDWARLPLAPEPRPSRPLIPSRPDGDQAGPALPPLSGEDGKRFERGRLIHRLLQTLPALTQSERRAAGLRYLAHAARHWPQEACQSLLGEVLGVLDSPQAALLFGQHSWAEVPLVGLLEGRVLSGQVDRLAHVGDEVWVVDFKTNQRVPAAPSAVPAQYVRQMDLYRMAVSHLWPQKRVRTFLLWTSGPELMEI